MKHSQNSTRRLSDEEAKLRKSEQGKKYYAANKDKIKARTNQYHIDNRDARLAAQKDYSLRRKYGITTEQRDIMLAEQGHKCAVCETDAPQRWNSDWIVDHCHTTGKVRGILCHPCNVALGLFRDNSHTLAKAIDYLGKQNG